MKNSLLYMGLGIIVIIISVTSTALIGGNNLYTLKENIFGSAGETTAAGGGITSLGGLTGATQTFVNDTNVTISSAGTEHTLGWSSTLSVGRGGTGASTLTDGGILLGSGTGAITALGVATNGQIPIGDGTTDPVLATITGTTNEITVTNGAGTITLDIPDPLIISKGGTNATAFSASPLLQGASFVIGSTNGLSLISTSSPTLGWFYATTTGATSTVTGFLNVTGTNSTSTFSGGLSVLGTGTSTYISGSLQTNLINVTSQTASSTFGGGMVIQGGVRLAAYNCSGLTSNGSLTTDALGYLYCDPDDGGGGAVTVNSGTANRMAYYSGATTIDAAANILITNAPPAIGIATSSTRFAMAVATSSGASAFIYTEESDKGTATATPVNVDWRASNVQRVTLGLSQVVVTFDNLPKGGKGTLTVCQDASGGRDIITWPSSVNWYGGATTTQTSGAGKCDSFFFRATAATSSQGILFGGSALTNL